MLMLVRFLPYSLTPMIRLRAACLLLSTFSLGNVMRTPNMLFIYTFFLPPTLLCKFQFIIIFDTICRRVLSFSIPVCFFFWCENKKLLRFFIASAHIQMEFNLQSLKTTQAQKERRRHIHTCKKNTLAQLLGDGSNIISAWNLYDPSKSTKRANMKMKGELFV